ncbi:MAG: hypothetical protein CM1200mP26_13770 [Acidimicrobiales bacterium]|nr:MAG: hypothetical protein CM1200mP26_13770 [Acidimicrobiales bacterium]
MAPHHGVARLGRLLGTVPITFFALVVVAGACTADPEGDGLSGGRTTTTGMVDVSDTERTAGLVPFTECDDLLRHLQTEAVDRVGPYGLGAGWYGRPVMLEAVAMTDDSSMESVAMARGSDQALVEGIDYSGTNVQEVGIDEPDLIKTDGRRILVVEDDRIHHVSLSRETTAGGTATLTDTLPIEGHWSRQMLLAGDRALIIADTHVGGDDSTMIPAAYSDLVPNGGWRSLTSLIEVDLSDPSNLQIANVLTVEGHHVSTRVVGGSARVVVATPPNELPFVYPQNENGEERATQFNREVVAETTLADWMPHFVLESANGTVVDGPLHQCTDVSRPTTFAGFSTLSVLTVPISEPLGRPNTTAVLAEGSTVYSGNEHLYVSTNAWVDPNEITDDSRMRWWNDNWDTDVHQFDVGDPTSTAYTASGKVPGHLLNQFAMSEHDGHLRVATTTGGPWRFEEDAESMVTVLTRRDGSLENVGQVGNMGRGERIFAVRYVGDVAYVVTFRQTDPFYTVDLSDPTAPVVRGELKITGYSGYLHPIGPDRILGIGQEATEEGRTTGTKVTLFDVSNLDDPVDLATWSPGGGHSGAEWDHHAFLWWQGRAVLPFEDWRANEGGAVILQVADDEIIEEGRIDHRDDEATEPVPPCPVLSMTGPAIDGAVVMACEAGSRTSMAGHWCDPMPREESKWWATEFGLDPENLPADRDIVVCWPNSGHIQPIQRMLVIGDGLWSYSWRRIQENALDDLDRRQVVSLD